MKKILFSGCSIATVLVASVWILSYRHRLTWFSDDHKSLPVTAVTIGDGDLSLSSSSSVAPVGRTTGSSRWFPGIVVETLNFAELMVSDEPAGFHVRPGGPIFRPDGSTIFDGVPFVGLTNVRQQTVIVRFWFLLLVCSLYPMVVTLRWCIARYRNRGRVMCGGCGYDLRGNVSGICPECGEVVGRSDTGCGL